MPDDPIRKILLAGVRQFVEHAIYIQGVRRIALVGSLTTEKSRPKDADVLVTVGDDINLRSLTALGRKLKGAGQSHSSGADIFLSNTSDRYIGRTCSWRECHPRMACRGHRCGIEPYFCDDLDVVSLDRKLIKNPPIELWPNVIRRVKVPDDVEEYLLGVIEEMVRLKP